MNRGTSSSVSYKLQTYRAHEVRVVRVASMANVIQVCRDGTHYVVSALLRTCEDNSPEIIHATMHQLVRAAEAYCRRAQELL